MHDHLLPYVINLILRMEKNFFFSILKNARFSGKGRQSLHLVNGKGRHRESTHSRYA